jgi:hypothetical protein
MEAARRKPAGNRYCPGGTVLGVPFSLVLLGATVALGAGACSVFEVPCATGASGVWGVLTILQGM